MASKTVVTKKDLKYREYVNRENDFVHHTFDEDMLQYEYLKRGDLRALDEAKKMFDSAEQGHLSEDPLTNMKYLFVCAATLACRYAMAGGMPNPEAYNASDLYITKMDTMKNIEEIKELELDMFRFYTEYMASLDQETVYSKPVVLAMDYIFNHLNQPVRLGELAEYAGISPSYLSGLFRKETGKSITEYVKQKKIETAENMLRYSDYSFGEISAALAFSSQSHFTKVFRESTGYTPGDYQRLFYRR